MTQSQPPTCYIITGAQYSCFQCGVQPRFGVIHSVLQNEGAAVRLFCHHCCPEHGSPPPDAATTSYAERRAVELLVSLQEREQSLRHELSSVPADDHQRRAEITSELDTIPAITTQCVDDIVRAHEETLRQERSAIETELQRINAVLRDLLDVAAEVMGRSAPFPISVLYFACGTHSQADPVLDPVFEEKIPANSRADILVRRLRRLKQEIAAFREKQTEYVSALLQNQS